MKPSILAATSLLAGVALSAPALGQTTATTTTDGAWRMPYERGFWGHAGISAGKSDLDVDCGSAACDTEDTLLRAFAGGRFNNAVGLELGLIDFGKFELGGAEADGWGADIALVAGFPIGENSAVFGKLGAIYSETEVRPGGPLPSGEDDGFGPRIGVGAQIGLTPNWALRADLDRYELNVPGGEEDVDSLTLGVQYTFR